MVFAAEDQEAEARGPRKRECQGRKQRDRHGNGERAEEGSGDAGDGDKREEDDDWRDGGEHQRSGDLMERLADSLDTAFAGVAMQDDVFDYYDGVVDDETDGGCETAERHQVEALVGEVEEDEGDQYGDGNDEPSDERGAPVA